MINYHTLSEAAYKTARYDFKKQLEGMELDAYVDSVGKPTIGVGFNLRDSDVRSAVFDEILRVNKM